MEKLRRSLKPSTSYDPLQRNIQKAFNANVQPIVIHQRHLYKNHDRSEISEKSSFTDYLALKKLKKVEYRKKNFWKIAKNVEEKHLTMLRFGFKTNERKENIYLKPLLKNCSEDLGEKAKNGSMSVSDLWCEKNISKFLDRLGMTKDNLLLKRLGEQTRKREQTKLLPQYQFIDQIYEAGEVQNNNLMIRRVKTQQSATLKLQQLIGDIKKVHQENLGVYSDINKKINKSKEIK